MLVAKMSSEIIRELFRSLETTMRQRMDVIEEIVRASSSKPTVKEDPFSNIYNILNHHEVTMRSIYESITNLTEQLTKISNSRMPVEAVAAVESDTDDTPVEAVEAEVEAEVAEAEALETPDESVEEEVEEEEEVEVEELELEQFTFKGHTYYRDSDNNVYGQDEEGDIIDEPIGTWNGKKIIRA